MRAHQFPNPERPKTFQMKDFLGVDFSTHESEVAPNRSPDAVNMISGQKGSIDKRYGFAHHFKVGTGTTANFSFTEVHNTYKEYIYTSGWEYTYKEMYGVLFANGNKVYVSIGDVFDGDGLITDFQFSGAYRLKLFTPPSGGLVDFELPTFGKPRFVKLTQYLYLLICEDDRPDKYTTGELTTPENTYLVKFTEESAHEYYSYHQFDLGWDISATSIPAYVIKLTDSNVISKLFYVPTTNIARNPAGTFFQPFESSNILNQKRKNLFLGDGTSTVYKLDATFYGTPSATVRLLNADGSWTSTTAFTASTGGIITFTSAPPVSPITGSDNVEITFQASGYDSGLLYGFKNFGYYGFNGKSDFVFLIYRDKLAKNRDYRLQIKDDLVYIPENGYTDFGTKDTIIIGYGRYGNEQVIFAKNNGGNQAIFMRSASLDNSGELIFPIRQGISGVGAINGDTFASLRDDAMWLSEYGVNALITNNVTNVQSVQDRGFYVNGAILSDKHWSGTWAEQYTFSTIHENRYYLFSGEHCYIADPRYKFGEKLSFSESFQYDWYYFKMPYYITTAITARGALYLGTLTGDVIRMKLPEHFWYDDSAKLHSDEYPFVEPALWATATNYSEKKFVKDAEGNYYFCLFGHNSSFYDLTSEKHWIKVRKETRTIVSTDYSVFHVPVIAYWTTPLMNMGNITSRKTLKNLWVRLGKFSRMSAIMYYRVQGIERVKSKQYDGVFDFNDIDFEQFTFSTDTDPSVLVSNRQEKKFMSIQFKIESRDENPFSLLEIVGEYTFNNKFKG